MREIRISRGYIALVDDEDFDRVSALKWKSLISKRKTKANVIYACKNIRRKGEHWTKSDCLYMHRFILGCSEHVDHKDGNGLNNQKHNLRPATMSQNMMNRAKAPGCSSKYKGVCWHFGLRRWQVHIHKNGKSVYLGSAVDEWDAALMYNEAALEEYGEFAWLNTKEEQCA